MSYIDDKNGVYKCGRKSLELNAFITAEISAKNLEFNVVWDKWRTKFYRPGLDYYWVCNTG